MTIDDSPLRDSYADTIDGVAIDAFSHSAASSMSTDVLAQVRQAICVTDADLDDPGPRIEFVNAAYLDIFACEPDEVMGHSPRFAQGPLTARPVPDRSRDHLGAGRSIRAQAINYRVDRTPFRLRWSIDPIRRDGRVVRFVALMADVTVEDRMRRRLAALDALLLTARSHTDDASRSQQAADSIAASLVPMLAEVAGATVRIGEAVATVPRIDNGATEPIAVEVDGLGVIEADVHTDAGRLFDAVGVEEIARHAAWLFGGSR